LAAFSTFLPSLGFFSAASAFGALPLAPAGAAGAAEAGLFLPATLSSFSAAAGASFAYFSLKARISLSYLSFSRSDKALYGTF
jgi:hypothetical protein